MSNSFAIRNVVRATVTIVMSFFLVAPSMLAQEVDRIQQARVKYLIKQLQSKNDEPDETESGGLHRQKYYKLEAQVPVYFAMHQLLAEGPAACDELVLNLKNAGYSYTFDGQPRPSSFSVGENCERLFDLIINCYRPELHLISTEQLELGGYKNNDRAAWWKANRHRPLWEIQVERIDQALALFQQLQKQSAPITSDIDQLTVETFQKRRQQNVETLKSLRQSIVLRQECHIPKTIDDPLNKFIWLPWQENVSTRKINVEPIQIQASKSLDPFRQPQ